MCPLKLLCSLFDTDSTLVIVTSSKPVAVVGESVTFTARVTSSNPPTWTPVQLPTGSVTFTVPGSGASLPQTLNGSGIAVFTTTFSSQFSSQTVTASYAQSTSFGASSGSTVQTVSSTCSFSVIITCNFTVVLPLAQRHGRLCHRAVTSRLS